MACLAIAPIVFLHGTAASRRQWRPLISHLPHPFEIFTLDLPHHVAHEVRFKRRSLSQEAQILLDRLLGLRQPLHLVGHSYGAALAMRIAMQWPGFLRSLTMFAPVMFHLLRDGYPIERQMHRDIARIESDVRRAFEDGAPERGARRFIGFWNGPGTFAAYAPETRQKVTARLNSILANFASLDQETWPLPDCARVICPTLGVYGENSPLLVQHLTRLVAGVVENAKVLSVSAAGHMLPVTHARAAAKLLSAHIPATETQALRPRPRAA